MYEDITRDILNTRINSFLSEEKCSKHGRQKGEEGKYVSLHKIHIYSIMNIIFSFRFKYIFRGKKWINFYSRTIKNDTHGTYHRLIHKGKKFSTEIKRRKIREYLEEKGEREK